MSPGPSASEFICPKCHAPILVSSQTWKCSSCAAGYPIRNGVARFVPASNYSDSFGFQWNRHRHTQLDSWVGKPISENRLFATTGWPTSMRGARILEAGSGAGRFTEILCRTGAAVYSFDYSDAVEANVQNNGSCTNLRLFQADILAIPLPEASFDHVLALGVLQHTPDPKAAFLSLARQVKPGGDIVIDVYRLSLVSLMQWKYLLRPLTRLMDPEKLYGLVKTIVAMLLGPTRALRRLGGRAGARLSPIVEYSHLALTPEQNLQWAILDTFDMYAPAHDQPQTAAAIRRWFEDAGLAEVEVFDGYNGIVGRGRRPAA